MREMVFRIGHGGTPARHRFLTTTSGLMSSPGRYVANQGKARERISIPRGRRTRRRGRNGSRTDPQ